MTPDPDPATPSAELRGYSIWLTGPEHACPRLLTAIERAGGDYRQQAVIQVIAPDRAALSTARALWIAQPDWDFRLFTSRPAVRAAQALGSVASLGRLGAVGRATAEAVTAAFEQPCFSPQDDAGAAALLQQPELSAVAVAGRRILILQGEGGRDLLDRGLAERGAAVSVARVYARAAAPLDLNATRLALPGQCIVSLSSIAIAEALAEASRQQGVDWPFNAPLLAWSPRIAAALRPLGYAGVTASAATATPAGLCGALLQLARATAMPVSGL